MHCNDVHESLYQLMKLMAHGSYIEQLLWCQRRDHVYKNSEIFFSTSTRVGKKTKRIVIMSIKRSTKIVKFMATESGVQALWCWLIW